MLKKIHPFFIITLLFISAGIVALHYGALVLLNRIVNFPTTHPQETLQIEQQIADFFHPITFPLKQAQMHLREPDTQILMPVYGLKKEQIADTWAAPRGADRAHEGQDLFAAKSTPIFSGTPGYVIRMITTDIGGNVVYILGAGGRRYYYAHLDRVPVGLRVGQYVTTDTVIGFVGNTGNAEGTPYHLHFGVYVKREAMDPLPLLVNRP